MAKNLEFSSTDFGSTDWGDGSGSRRPVRAPVVDPRQHVPTAAVVGAVRLSLLGGFAVDLKDRGVELVHDAQRLIAFLAIKEKRMPRCFVASSLWPTNSERRALNSLRSALWRVRDQAEDLIDADKRTIGLCPSVSVDLQRASELAKAIVSGAPPDDVQLDPQLIMRQLLPGWYDDWILVAQEQFRQQSMHALEVIAEALGRAGEYARAIEAAMASVQVDPFRESAHRLVIRVHLAEGNSSEAVRHFRVYRAQLNEELGIEPSAQLTDLIDSVTRCTSS